MINQTEEGKEEYQRRLKHLREVASIKDDGIREGIEIGKVEGIEIGIEKGKAEGIQEGELKGEIRIIEKFYQDGKLSDDEYKNLIEPLKQKLSQFN